MPADIAWIYASTRGGASDGAQAPLKANPQGEQLVAQGLPPYTEMTRRGLGWQVIDTSATAAVVVRPSTTAGVTLWNGETGATGKSYIIDRAWVFNLVTTAAISGYSIWGCVHPTGMTAPTADITAIKSMSGRSSYSGNARVDTAATVVDDGWFPLNTGTLTGGVTTAPSGTQVVALEGRIIIPPSAGFSINVVGTITGLTFTHGLSWYELYLPVNE
jgi:hypothetical protein